MATPTRGRLYLIPQHYQGGTNPEALSKLAIDQARLQDRIANRIKAKKALILLDTCESGCLGRSQFNFPRTVFSR